MSLHIRRLKQRKERLLPSLQLVASPHSLSSLLRLETARGRGTD